MENFKSEVRVGILVLGAIFLVFGLFLYFGKGQLLKLSERVKEVQIRISQQRNVSSEIIKLREDEKLAAKYEKVMNALVPVEGQMFGLQRWLVTQGQIYNVGVTFGYTGDGIEPQGENLGNLPFSLKLSGELGDLAAFLDFLENKNSQFLMSFDNLSVGLGQGGLSQAAVTGKAYFRAQNE